MKRVKKAVTFLFEVIRKFSDLPDIKTIKLNYLAEGIRWQFLDAASGQIYEAVIKYVRDVEPEEELIGRARKKRHAFLDIPAKHKSPTKRHRPAIWEVMLGTVSAMDDNYKVKYFDTDIDGAKEFAGILRKKDLRLWKNPGGIRWADDPANNPKKGQLVLWVEKG